MATGERALMESLLAQARCPDPNCYGAGQKVAEAEVTVPVCCGSPLDNGECCGRPAPGVDLELQASQCQWCHERAAVLGRPDLLEKEEAPDPFANIFDNALPF